MLIILAYSNFSETMHDNEALISERVKTGCQDAGSPRLLDVVYSGPIIPRL